MNVEKDEKEVKLINLSNLINRFMVSFNKIQVWLYKKPFFNRYPWCIPQKLMFNIEQYAYK